jgi:hypothetical protein
MAVARSLCDPTTQPPSDAALRRAVSTAYYALFHTVLRAAATRFMGHGQQWTGGYALLYRSFDHGYMKEICKRLDVATLAETTKRQLRRSAISADMRFFARTFVPTQELRHLADYDPTAQFLPSEVAAVVDEADNALAAFGRVPANELADILALLMVKSRT